MGMKNLDNLLGKIDLLRGQIKELRPLVDSEARQLRAYYRVGLTYSSNALEGNSLSESETKVVIEDGLTVAGKPLRDHLEATGHRDAFEYLYGLQVKREILEGDICELHRLFFHQIESAKAGAYRDVRVFISGSSHTFPGPESVTGLMREFCESIPNLRVTHHSVVFAALLHLRFIQIHPFVDGNGRTARLLMNLGLLQDGYPIAIIPPVLRSEYIAALEAANQGNDDGFVLFIARQVLESMKDYVRLVSG